MRLLVLLLITLLPPLCAQQQDAESDDAPPSGPTIREVEGVVIIGSRPESPIVEETVVEEEIVDEGEAAGSEGEQDPAEGEAGEREAPDGETAIGEEGAEGEVAAGEAEAEPEAPSSTIRSVTDYDVSGRKIRHPESQFSRQSESGSENAITLQSISNREVPYLSERGTVLRETETEKSVEKTTQRYDPNGNPTHQELVREETRKLPDGTVVTTATMYIENINGRMEIVDRTITRRKEHNGRIENLTTTEKPSINGGFQTIIREESIETKQGENASTITTVRQVDNGGGRLVVAGREETVMRQGRQCFDHGKDRLRARRNELQDDRLGPNHRGTGDERGWFLDRNGRNLRALARGRVAAFSQRQFRKPAAAYGDAGNHDWRGRRDDRNHPHQNSQPGRPHESAKDTGDA